MGKFNLDNYSTVDDRITALKKDHPTARIITERVTQEIDSHAEIFKAFIYLNGDEQQANLPVATGYAHEFRETELKTNKHGKKYADVNYTAWLENCETSAIGRALANAGYTGKGARPSLEEMQKVERVHNQIEEANEEEPKETPKTKKVPVKKTDSKEVEEVEKPKEKVPESKKETSKTSNGGTVDEFFEWLSSATDRKEITKEFTKITKEANDKETREQIFTEVQKRLSEI